MRKLIPLYLLVFSLHSVAQDTILFNKTVELESSFSAYDSVVVKAINTITLKQGFSYSSGSTKSFHTEFVTWNADEPDLTLTPGTSVGVDNDLDGGYLVGTISGEPNVSPSGAATYSIPLSLPRGTRGVVPQLSINYNSQSGLGTMGRGWILGGLSSIMATGKNQYYDNEFSTISSTDSECRVIWDGQRLVGINSNGLDADSFRTEQVNNFKIIKESETGYVWFKVLTPDGRTLEYGNSSDSRLKLDTITEWKWMLNKVYDRNGNTITYSYTIDESIGEILLDEVKYGGASASLVNTVKFHYSTRTDISYAYIHDDLFLNNKLLDSISMQSNSSYFGSYGLSYSSSTGESLLDAIIQYDKDNNRYNATTVDWSSPTFNINASTTSVNVNYGSYYHQYTGDFTGDGISDMVAVELNSSTDTYVCYLYAGSTNGLSTTPTETIDLPRSYTHVFWDEIESMFNSGCSGTASSDLSIKDIAYVFSGDFDGDGIEELFVKVVEWDVLAAGLPGDLNTSFSHLNVFSNISLYSNICSHSSFITSPSIDSLNTGIGRILNLDQYVTQGDTMRSFLLNTSAPYDKQRYQFPDLAGYGYNCIPDQDSLFYYHPDLDTMLAFCPVPDNSVIWGEFTGDGKMDYFNYNESTSSWQLKKYLGGTNIFLTETSIDGDLLGMIDLNGDGIQAWVALGEEDIQTTSASQLWNSWCPSCSYSDPDDWNDFLATNSAIEPAYDTYCSQNCGGVDNTTCRGDFISNGTVNINNGFELYAKHVTGRGPEISFGNFLGTHTPYNPMFTRAIAMDINADGRNDLLLFDEDSLKKVYYNFIPSYSNGELSYSYSTEDLNKELDDNPHVGDFNGDGILEIVFPDNDRQLCFVSTGNPGHFLSSVTNGLGVETSYIYKPLTDASIYTKEIDATYPVMDFSAPWYVVSNVTAENGVANDVSVDYEYKGAKIHLQGKVFLGFMSTTIENDLQNTSQESYFSYETKFYQTYPDSTIQKVGSTSVSKNFSSVSVDSLAAHKFRLQTDTVVNVDALRDITTTNSIDYDSNTGLVVEKTTQVNNAAIITESYTYKSAGWHVAALPATVSKKYQRGSASSSDSINISYNSKGNLLQKKEFCGTDRELITKYFNYDSFGNPERISIAGKRGQSLTSDSTWTDLTYSSDGRFLLSKSGMLDHIESYQYDASTGVMESKIGSNRKITTYDYGPFNQLQETEHPDYIKEILVLSWASGVTGNPTGSLFYKWANVSGTAEVLTFYDETGRELRTIVKGFDDESIYVDTEYDTKGRILKESLPYFSGNTPIWATYTYDSYGRVLTETAHDTTLTEYTYDDINKKVTTEVSEGSDSYTSIRITNSLGEVTESKDNLVNTVYNVYLPDGKLDSSYVGSQSIGTSFTYDAQGNRTSITDPDAGTITSLFDAFGNLLRQINAKDDSTTFVYDALGRVTKSTDSRGDINYSYLTDTTHAAFGQVDSVYNSNKSLLEIYTYERNFGRLTSQSNSQTGKNFTHNFTYDPFGRPETRTYPSGFEIEFKYTPNGDLDEVTGDGLTLWSCSDVSALGQITSYDQGSYSTTVSYSNTGKLNGITTSGSLIDWDYGFDNLGNLSFRYDGISNQKEEFTYDGLNRLTDITYYENGSTHNSDGDLTIGYDNSGNITSKTGLSTDIDYGELGAGPHALTTINSPDASYVPPPQTIIYNCFNKVESITDTLSGGTPLNIAFSYGLNNQRVRTTTTRNSTVERVKYFDMDYEEDSTSLGIKKYHYIYGGNGISAIFVKQGAANDTMFYVFADHLGSLTTVVNASTSAVTRYSFNAWGMPRDATDWTSGYSGELFAGRGFTGHEHLTEFSLINMNGRVYDPILGRFLSPDPYIQSPAYPNNFNRYAYALNNPLIYTDPSGEFIFTLLALLIPGAQFLLPVAIGTDIGWMTGGIRGATTEGSSFIEGAWKGAVVGAIGGSLSMVGGAGMSFAANLALGTGSGALTGGLDAALWGNDIGKGMLWGAAAGAAFTTFTSENFKNMLKGEKFLTNESVFNNMVERGAGKQEILNYFKFEGTYLNEEGLSSFWYDKNDLSQYGIKYRNGSFDSYETLYGSYLKESYHLNKFAKNGLAELDLGNSGSMGLDRWPEERLGAIHLYKNNGLIGGDVQYINAIRTSESWINSMNQFGDYNPMYHYNPFKTRWWHRIVFNIPRRW